MDTEIDPIKFEVIRNALVEATEEMAVALRRSAYSTNVKTRQDFSCAFFDGDLRIIAQALHPAGAPGLDGRAGAKRGTDVRAGKPCAGRHAGSPTTPTAAACT